MNLTEDNIIGINALEQKETLTKTDLLPVQNGNDINKTTVKEILTTINQLSEEEKATADILTETQVVEIVDSAVSALPVATTTENGLMSATDKTKLDGLQNYDVATTTENGLMSSTDKVKLDGLQEYGVATPIANGLMSSTDKVKLNSLQNYDVATTTENGLMSSYDKAKLNSMTNYTFKFKTFTISHSQCLPWQRGANLTYYKSFTFSQFGVTGPIISCQLSNWSGGTDTSTWTQLYLDSDTRFIINSDTESSFTTLYIRVVYI